MKIQTLTLAKLQFKQGHLDKAQEILDVLVETPETIKLREQINEALFIQKLSSYTESIKERALFLNKALAKIKESKQSFKSDIEKKHSFNDLYFDCDISLERKYKPSQKLQQIYNMLEQCRRFEPKKRDKSATFEDISLNLSVEISWGYIFEHSDGEKIEVDSSEIAVVEESKEVFVSAKPLLEQLLGNISQKRDRKIQNRASFDDISIDFTLDISKVFEVDKKSDLTDETIFVTESNNLILEETTAFDSEVFTNSVSFEPQQSESIASFSEFELNETLSDLTDLSNKIESDIEDSVENVNLKVADCSHNKIMFLSKLADSFSKKDTQIFKPKYLASFDDISIDFTLDISKVFEVDKKSEDLFLDTKTTSKIDELQNLIKFIQEDKKRERKHGENLFSDISLSIELEVSREYSTPIISVKRSRIDRKIEVLNSLLKKIDDYKHQKGTK